MRTTLDIEHDVLAAANELAHRQSTSAGRARLAGSRTFLAPDQKLVTNEEIDQLRDREGL